MIERALAIDGWTTEDELRWLAEQAKAHRRILEIGCHLGRSTRALADNTPGVVWAVDDFRGPRDIDNGEFPGSADGFRRNCGDLIESGKLVGVIADHRTAPRHILGQFDMIFIDGDHEYLSVLNDVLEWRERVAPGGLLCGHDESRIMVKLALEHTFGEYMVARGTDIWYVVRDG